MNKRTWGIINAIEILLAMWFFPNLWEYMWTLGQFWWMFAGAVFALVVIWIVCNYYLIRGWEWWD